MIRSGKWGVVVLGTLLVAGVAIPLFGEKPNFSDMDKNQARDITQLIEQGQIGLAEAIKLAETKANGKALECFANLEFGSPQVAQPMNTGKGANEPTRQPGTTKPGTTGNLEDKNTKRIIYHVRVFANGDLTAYMVDAKTREVTAMGDRFKQTSDRPMLDRDNH